MQAGEWDEGLLRFLLTVFLVSLVVLLTWAVLGGGDASTGEEIAERLALPSPRTDHALRLCRRYAEAHRLDAASVGWSAMTVRDLRAAADHVGVGIGIWDRLPDDHFIANCSTPITPATPTIRCGNGKTTPDSRGQSVLVDDSGRTSRDPLAAAAPTKLLCSLG